jgi:hypothetical protein
MEGGGVVVARNLKSRWRETEMESRVSIYALQRESQPATLGRDFSRSVAPACATTRSFPLPRLVIPDPGKLQASQPPSFCLVLRKCLSIMAPDSRRRNSQATSAEISLVAHLKNCLVNLPSSLCSLLINSNTVCRPAPLSSLNSNVCIGRTKYHYRTELPCTITT